MMEESNLTIEEAILEVRQGYPFPEIIDDTKETIKALGRVIQSQRPEGGRLLDIGCGALDKATVFQKLGYECAACDDFQDPWHREKQNLDPVLEFATRCGVQVHNLDEGYSTPWEEGSFDVVTIVNVIEHLHESPRVILNLAGSYLKEGGLLVVAMPNSVNLRKRLAVILGRSNYTPARGFFENDGAWRGHVREYTLRETNQTLEWSGFNVVVQQTFHGMVKQRLRNVVLRLLFFGICLPIQGFKDSLLVAAKKPIGWVPRQPDLDAMDKSLTDSWIT